MNLIFQGSVIILTLGVLLGVPPAYLRLEFEGPYKLKIRIESHLTSHLFLAEI